MNRIRKNFLILIIVALIVFVVCFFGRMPKQIATKKCVIVKVNNDSLLAMGTENSNGLYSIGIKEMGNTEYKQGQEILIYFDGMILATYPAQLGHVSKVKIIKENSDTKIPQNILRFAYSSKENVKIEVNELTNKGIAFSVTDKNDIPYMFLNNYTICKKIKNENYTGVGQKIGEDTENSTSGFTRHRNRIYMGRVEKNFGC